MNEAVSSLAQQDRAAGFDRVTRRAIVAATVLGAAWRIAMLINRWNLGLVFNDSVYYSYQAQHNAQGEWFRLVFTNGPGAEHPPVASLLMTPASLLPHLVSWQRATSTLLGIAVVPLIALLGLRLGGRRVAVIAAFVAAVYPNLWINDSLVMSESAAVFFVVIALLCAWQFQQRFDYRSAIITGVVVALAALTRSEMVALAPLLALIGFRSRPRLEWLKRAVVMLVVVGAVIAPWMIYNSTRFDAPVLLSANEGITILGANCDATYGGPKMGGWLTSCLNDVVIQPGEDASELSRREHKLAVQYMREHVRRLPLVVAARLLRTVDLYGLHDLVLIDMADQRGRVQSWGGILSWWLLAPLAAVGWWRSRRRCGWILLAPAISVFATAAIFYGAHRLRAPLEPVVVICAAMAMAGSALGQRLIGRVLAHPRFAALAN
ncbi:MAG: glycosyltransferase family 39 protein [Actinomycetota bacterium]